MTVGELHKEVAIASMCEINLFSKLVAIEKRIWDGIWKDQGWNWDTGRLKRRRQ